MAAGGTEQAETYLRLLAEAELRRAPVRLWPGGTATPGGAGRYRAGLGRRDQPGYRLAGGGRLPGGLRAAGGRPWAGRAEPALSRLAGPAAGQPDPVQPAIGAAAFGGAVPDQLAPARVGRAPGAIRRGGRAGHRPRCRSAPRCRCPRSGRAGTANCSCSRWPAPTPRQPSRWPPGGPGRPAGRPRRGPGTPRSTRSPPSMTGGSATGPRCGTWASRTAGNGGTATSG